MTTAAPRLLPEGGALNMSRYRGCTAILGLHGNPGKQFEFARRHHLPLAQRGRRSRDRLRTGKK